MEDELDAETESKALTKINIKEPEDLNFETKQTNFLNGLALFFSEYKNVLQWRVNIYDESSLQKLQQEISCFDFIWWVPYIKYLWKAFNFWKDILYLPFDFKKIFNVPVWYYLLVSTPVWRIQNV